MDEDKQLDKAMAHVTEVSYEWSLMREQFDFKALLALVEMTVVGTVHLYEEIAYDKWPRVTILVPLDGSELAESVLPYFEVLAKQRGAKLVDMVLLRVCEPCEVPLFPPGSRASMTPYDSSVRVKSDGYVKREMAKRRRETKQYLARVEKRFKDVGLTVRSEMLDGNPADEIINYASRNPFNLIVMATHGRSGLSRWAYGSVADRVLRGVSSPIFLVRPG